MVGGTSILIEGMLPCLFIIFFQLEHENSSVQKLILTGKDNLHKIIQTPVQRFHIMAHFVEVIALSS